MFLKNLNAVFCFALFQDLMKDLKSELSKNLERLIIGLMLTPAEFDAKMMRKAMEVRSHRSFNVYPTGFTGEITQNAFDSEITRRFPFH